MTEVRLGPDNASFTEKVNNEYTKNIYRYVTEIDKSLSKDLSEIDFERAVQDEAYATEMYGFISSHDNTFKEDVSLEQFLSSVKKKELEQPTESVSEDGLSESQLATRPIESERILGGLSDRRFEVQQEAEQRKLSGIPEDEPIDLPESFVVADEFYTPEQRALRQRRIDEFDLQGDAEEFRRYQELMDAQGEVEIPELTTVLQNTNVSQDSVDALRMAYGQYGFRFEGDVADGNGTIVAYNNYFGDAAAIELKVHNGEVLGIEQLNVFLSNNKAPVNAVTPQERSEAERALRIQEMRRGSRKQLDGRVDTHNLSFVEQNGKYLVFPTLFPKDPTSTLSNPSAWLDLNEEQALDEAKRRDEVLFVNTEEEAKALVDGSWQDFDTMDLEGERLYREYGRDYYAERQAGRDLQDMMDEYKAIETLEYGTRVEDNELVRKYPQYFIDGNMVRDDMGDKKKELELSIDILSEQMDEEELERLNEDFDSILDTRLSERATRAASIGRDARILMDDAKVRAQTQFGLNIEDLVGSEAADPREFQEKLNIVETYAAGAKERFQAAQMYEQAELYFDKKLNKQITGILVDGASNSWNNEWERSVARGEAGILLTSMHFGLGPNASREDVVRAAGQMLDHENKNTGRSKARVNDAATWGQTKDAFFESPLDYTAAVLSESIGMLMPQVFNWRTGGMMAAGAGVGALTAGPGGALAGAIEGLGYAATGAFAIAEYGLEMGQAFIDVAMEEGYDLKDPIQAMRAAQDLEMWERAEKRGHQRGVPIAIASALSNLAAGRIITASKYLPGRVRIPAQAAGVMAERVTIDPLFEMAGEYGALVSSGQFTGSTANWKEIYAEGLGAMGQGAPMAVLNTASRMVRENRFKMAVGLMDIGSLSEERANLGMIQRWVNNMEKLEKISPEMAEYIRRNVGLLREANVLLGRKPNSRGRFADPEVTARLVRLLEAKKIIEGDGRSSQQNQSGAFSELLSRINDEIAETVRTGRLSEEGVELNPSQREFTPGMEPDLSQEEELELLVAKARPGVYQIDGSFMDRVKFVNTIKEEKDIRKLKKAVVLNDPLVASLLKIQQNAIQKRKATPLPVGEQAQSSEEVDEEVRVDPPTQEELDDYKEGSLTSERISLIEGDIVEILASKGELDAIQQQFYEFNAEEIDRRVTEFNAFVEDNVITEDGKPVTKENLGIIAKAKNAVAALAKNFPDVKVVLHDTRESYEKASKDTTGSGTYLWDQKEIHIDLTTANDRTVAHETFHAVLRNSIDESDVRALMDDFVETLLKVLPEDSDILSRLNEFMQRYEEGVRSEEFVAEFFGMVADAYPELDVKEKGVVARFLERLASMLNIELNLSTDLNKRDKQILSLLETLSGKVAEGKTITKREISAFKGLTETKKKTDPEVEVESVLPKRSTLGFSDKELVLQSEREFGKNGAVGVYVDPDTGEIAAVVAIPDKTSDANYLGYKRLYENGKATNKFAIKADLSTAEKGSTRPAFEAAVESLPDDHVLVEADNISSDGITLWLNQLRNKYAPTGNVFTVPVNVAGTKVDLGGQPAPGRDVFNRGFFSKGEANSAEAKLNDLIKDIPGAKITRKSEANNLFSFEVTLPELGRSSTSGVSSQQLALDNLRASQQRSSEYKDSDIEALAFEGILAHFTVANIREFEPGRGRVQYYGEGIYFTGRRSYASLFSFLSTNEMVSFVDVSKMNLLTIHNSYNVSAELENQIVDMLMEMGPAYDWRGGLMNRQEVFDMLFDSENPGLTPLFRVHSQVVRMGLNKEAARIPAPKNVDANAGQYVRPLFEKFFPEYQGIVNREDRENGLPIDVVVWDYDAINKNIVSAPLNRLKNIRNLSASEEKLTRPRWGGRSSQQVNVESNEDGSFTFRTEGGRLDAFLDGNVVTLDNIFVEPDVQRQGVATQLVDAAMDEFRDEESLSVVDEDGNTIEEPQPFIIAIGTRVTAEGDAFYDAVIDGIEAFNRRNDSKPEFNEDGLSEVRMSRQMGLEEATQEWVEENFKNADAGLREFLVEFVKQPGVRLFLNPIGGGFFYANQDKGSTELDVRTSIYMERGLVYLDLLEVVAGDKSQGAGTRFMQDFVAALDASNQSAELLAWPPKWYQQGMSDEEMEAISKRLQSFYSRFGFTPKSKFDDNSMTREPGAVPKERTALEERTARERANVLTSIADTRTKKNVLGHIIAQTYDVYSEQYEDKTEFARIDRAVDPYDEGVLATDLYSGRVTAEQIEEINDEYGDGLINEDGFAENFEDFVDSDIVDDYVDLVIEEKEISGRLRNVERRVKEEGEAAGRRERRLGKLEDNTMALEHILAVNEDVYGRTETDVYNQYEAYLEGRLDEADKEYLRSLELGIDVETGEVDNASNLYDVFQELQDVREQRNDLERRSSQQRAMETDGTGLDVQGTEEVVTGEVSPTVLDKKNQELTDDYRLEDAVGTIKSVASRAVSAARKAAAGKVSYNKRNPRTGKVKVITVEYPYQNKKLLSLLNRRTNAAKKATGKKKAALMERVKETTSQILDEFVDTMTENILAVYDTLTPEFIEASKEWYVGANRVANELARKYNISPEQAGAVLAVLSPQNDWFNNISVAERAIEVMSKHSNTPFSREIFEKALDKNKTGAWSSFLKDAFARYEGMTLEQMNEQGVALATQTVILRAIDQALYPGKVLLTDPDGRFLGFDTTPVRWGATSEIAKAISAFRNPDIDSIRMNLGYGNKVRNFYNNIVDPNSSYPYVTADTHAVAVAMSTPMSADDAGGVGLFDGGFSPMYMLVKEAYINAAEIAGIRPREMQSITWEAVRVGMNNANRTAAAVEKNKSKLKSLVENENVSPYEAARRILINNPSVNPEWATARGIQVQIPDLREGVREKAESRGRDILSLRGRSGRDVGDTGAGVGVQPTEDRSSQQRLAPNGKPSNLTPEQYDLVRTEAFKNWFGDWENDPKNASKIVDDNGEPMVVYHGSVDPDIQEFSEEGARERRRSGLNELGVFFSSNRDLAQDYAKGRAEMSRVADEQMRERGVVRDDVRQGDYVPSVYAAFLDMKNPYRFDGKGKFYPDYYNEVPYLEIWPNYGKSGKRAVTAYLGDNTAYETPYDGVVAENVIDYHSFASQPDFDPLGDTVIVPFSSKPTIKLADGSNTTFSTDDSRISRQIPPSRQVEKNVEEAFREGTPFEASDFEVKSSQQKLERLAQPDDSMQDIIDRGRERYMPDSVIVAVLIKKYGRKNMKAISNAMAINYDIFRAMPKVFGDVKGGLKAGREIYIDVMKALDEFASPKKEKLKPLRGKVRNDRIAELRKEFPKEEEKSDKQLLKDHPRKVKLIAPTKAEVVAKAMELLTENPEFKKQTPDLQDKMVVGFNRAMSTRANKGIQNKLRELRNNISMRKQGAKAAAEVKNQMRALMEEALPKAVYSKGEVKRMLGIIDRVNEKNYQVEAEKLISVIESKRQEMSNNVLKDIQRFVRKAARTYKTSSGRVRTRGLDAAGQAYFQEAERVMLAIKNNDVETLGRMAEEHANNALVNELINARNEGAKLTVKEQSLLDRVSAYDMFIRLLDMNLEEREAVLEDLRINEGFSRFALNQQRLINARRAEALRQGAAEDVASNYGSIILGPDGLPMNDNEIGAKRSVILARWKDSTAREKYDMLKDLMKTMSQESAGKLAKGLRQGIHLGTYSSILGDYFYENIFSSVNRMEEEYNRGVINLSAKIDELANSIDGIEDGYAEIAELAMSNTKMFTLNMKGRQQAFFMDSLMRLYALSLNPLQRQRLVEMGIDMSELDAIIDPRLKEFVEKTVDFLSNEYYEGINDVYRSVNSVNLPHIENYFPTQTLVPTKVSINELKEGLLGMPSAQTASALKLRTATTGEIALGSEAGGLSFFQVLEQHNKSMERFKAFAEGTRDINSILSTQELRSLLTVFNGNQMLNLLVNNSVNPEQFVSEMSYPLADWMTKKFTFAALAFKVFQAFKQFASIPMAFEGYKYRPDSNRFTDALMFSFDVARLTVHMLAELATLGKYKGPVAEAMDISATFQQRVKQGFSGDIYTLEQGSVGIRNPRDKFKKGQRFVKGMERAGGMTTAIGDIGGVMGYFVNYRRNIENGMSKEEALEKFNDFNVTQQSRRPSERVPVQIYQNGILRLFTAFGSTYFLYANNTIQAGNKILRAIRKGEKPSSKDVRRFYLNAIYGHVIWTMAANASLLIKGDKEDREKALKRMLVSPLGPLTLIPIVGAQVKQVMNALAGDDFKASVGLDPLEGLIREVKKSFKEERYGRAVSEIFEYGLGVNFDMFRGLYKIAEGEEVTEGTYEALGIPKTTRPESDE